MNDVNILVITKTKELVFENSINFMSYNEGPKNMGDTLKHFLDDKIKEIFSFAQFKQTGSRNTILTLFSSCFSMCSFTGLLLIIYMVLLAVLLYDRAQKYKVNQSNKSNY